jgi:hypothetical protein
MKEREVIFSAPKVEMTEVSCFAFRQLLSRGKEDAILILEYKKTTLLHAFA